MTTKQIAGRVAELVAEAARERAFNWRWDAAHGEVMDPEWARGVADDLDRIEVWLAPDGLIKARTPNGAYAAYELLEGALGEVLPQAAFLGVGMDWRGGDYRGVAVAELP